MYNGSLTFGSVIINFAWILTVPSTGLFPDLHGIYEVLQRLPFQMQAFLLENACGKVSKLHAIYNEFGKAALENIKKSKF